MNFLPFNLKGLFYPIDSFKNILILSLFLILSWAFFSEILKIYKIIFYDFFDFRILFSNLIFSFFIIIYFRSIVLSSLVFFIFMTLPFLTYFFLRKGFLYGDINDLNELMFALGNLSTIILISLLGLLIIISIITNIKYFKIRIFILQLFLILIVFFSYKHPENYLKVLYPQKPNIDAFNISASFRFIGPIDGFFYNYLDTLAFEKKLQTNQKILKYDDFRSFDLSDVKKFKNIHVIILESFIDPIDFSNIEISKDIIPDQWIKYKKINSLQLISPVIGGGSAQAEFELLCGAPSILEYGTEFNRIGLNETSCLPKYLKKYGYKTIASQPMYGSFFNIENAYKQLGFSYSFLAPKFDMTDKNNGWLSDRSFFHQHFEFIKPFLNNEKPILNYLFAVGCHSTLGQKKFQEKVLSYSKSKPLENFLNCNLETIKHVTEYIDKIKSIDPESIFIVLPDHNPPGIKSETYLDAGYICDSTKEKFCGRNTRGIMLGFENKNIFKDRKLAYYEIPEIIINQISNNKLCSKIDCFIAQNGINMNGTIVDRKNLSVLKNQSLSKYHKKIYLSLLTESWSKIYD